MNSWTQLDETGLSLQDALSFGIVAEFQNRLTLNQLKSWPPYSVLPHQREVKNLLLQLEKSGG